MDLNSYTNFVNKKLSKPSQDLELMISEIHRLVEESTQFGINIPALFTAGEGLSAEAGEFVEIIKKMKYQGKPFNEDNYIHLKKELGDLAFYFIVACIGLNINPYDVIDMNVEKLDARYKEGFTVEESEIREEGDI